MKMNVVYWIHLPEHSDPCVDGYVGVAENFSTRLQRHFQITSRMDTHFARAIRLYGWKNLVKEVIFTGTSKECYVKEAELRPNFQIGWNEAIGGFGGDRSEHIDYAARAKPKGNTNPREGELNPFFGKTHSLKSVETIKRVKAKSVITTPEGTFYGFNDLARHLKVHKATAKKLAIKNGWEIHDQSEVYAIN